MSTDNDMPQSPESPETPDAGGAARDTEHDDALQSAGSRLREAATALSGDAIAVTALRKSERQARRRSRFAAAAFVAALAAAGLAWTTRGGADRAEETAAHVTKTGDIKPRTDAALAKAQLLVSKLDPAPIDPTKVKLTAKIRSYAGCPELLSDLQQVGAEHVGSQGFGGTNYMVDRQMSLEAATTDSFSAGKARAASTGETIGTNVQVEGVDELDMVKAVGNKVYRLLNNRLFIVDTTSKSVVGYLPLDSGDKDRRSASTQSILIAGTKLLVIGSESVQSEPIAGDPSASTSSHQFVTLTTVDIADPAKPTVTERVRIAGNLVSARLVKDQVRLVTGSSLPDIGFVMPTSPESIPVALEQNRLAVASSAIEDWIPAWDTGTGTPTTPLVSCDKVTMPETFAGVSMTSMAQFTLGQPFAPKAMGLLAPSTDVYATAADVTVASNIWVDPAQRETLKFDDWKTAIHHYRFAVDGPAYVGSAAVNGSVSGQFAFGQVGDRLGVIASATTPWGMDPSSAITLHLLDTATALREVGKVEDIGDGAFVRGIRFTPKRVLVSTSTNEPDGTQSVTLHAVDVSNATAPRKAGKVGLTGSAGYLHPTDDTHAIAIGSKSEKVSENNQIAVAVAEAIDLTNPDSPTVTGTWKAPNAASAVEEDHHAFLWWSSKSAFGFGMNRYEINPKGPYPPPVGVMVSAASGALAEIGQATPVEVDAQPSCAVTTADDLGAPDQLKQMIPPESKLLLCDAPNDVPRYPGYQCSNVGSSYSDMVESAVGASELDETLLARVWLCTKSGPPAVERMLVVDGGLWMLTTESLEKVNADTMASETVIPVG